MPTPLIVILSILGGLTLLIAGIASLRATITLEYKEEVTVWLRVLFIKLKLVPGKKKKVDPKDYTPKRFRRMLAKKRKKELKKWQKAQLKKQKKQEKKEKKKAERQAVKEGTLQPKRKRSLLENLTLIKALLDDIPPRFLRHLKIKLSRIVITVATDDAAKTAVLYGAVSQVVAYIVAFLDQMSRLRYAPEAEVAVNADFLAEKPTADVKLAVSVRVWHIFDLLIAALRVYIKNR